MRNPLVGPLINLGLALGAWLDRRAGRRAAPATDRIGFGLDPLQTIDFWSADDASGGAHHPAPLILYVHGGGWSHGNPENATGRAKIAHFTGRGICFASTGYRLVPEAKVEDQAADVAQALAALLADADRLGIDRKRVLLMGHSAGAQLVALIGTDPRWLSEVGLSFNDIAGIVALDGAAYDVPLQVRDAPLIVRSMYLHAFGRDPQRQRALSAVSQAAAPNVVNWMLLHVKRSDGLRQCETLTAALRRAGSTVEVVTLPGNGLFGHVACNRRLGDPAWPGTRAVDQWIDRILASRNFFATRITAPISA